MEELKSKARLNSFNISMAYVGIGTLALFTMTSEFVQQNDLIATIFGLINLLTIPVCFVGFGILYSGQTNSVFLVLISQLMVFFVFWFAVYRYLLKRYQRNERKTN